MAKNKKKNPTESFLVMSRRLARERQLEREKVVGRARSKSFGGKPSTDVDRRAAKKNLRNLDGEKD